MNEHTKGLLRVGHSGAVVADHPIPEMSGSDATEYYGGHLVAESVTAANARRLVACWNACHGLPTDELEQKGLACAFGTQLLLLEQHRDTLLEALNGVMGVMNNSHGVAGWHQNGAIATLDELLPEVAAALEFAEGEKS
ncbi:hypothetical protein [Aeromonas media]|uniref:hypothetical protein n=1 Tax=Aeromonas media TaxID=651 RepID=UPI0005BE36B8|nr:hypothetical protein [Aeromonas media]